MSNFEKFADCVYGLSFESLSDKFRQELTRAVEDYVKRHDIEFQPEFIIDEIGFYKTRDNKKVFIFSLEVGRMVSGIIYESGEILIKYWYKNGFYLLGKKMGLDIISNW